MMFAAPFSQLLWKEYRVHRALWLSCLFMGCVFQLVLWSTVLEPDMRAASLAGAASFFPVMYAVGCGALLFANEREDRTSEWLLSLATPVAPTLTAKFGFGMISTLLLQIVLALFSLIVLRDTPYVLSEMFVPFALTVLVWSSLGSLVSRRVLESIPTMTLLCMLPHLVLLAVLGRTLAQGRSLDLGIWIGVVVFSMCAAGLDIYLGRRWCQGSYLDASLFNRVTSSIGQLRLTLTGRETVKSRLPVRIEHEESWRRLWQRMIWQERHRDSIPYWLLFCGSILSFLMATAAPVFTEILIGFVAIIPVTMGILGFRSDQGLCQLRFLANRGLSPRLVWLVKQSVWLPRAIVLPLIFCMITVIAGLFLHPILAMRLRSIVDANIGTLSSILWIPLLLGYASGQLAAMTVRRSVLAIVSAIVLNVVTVFWFFLMVSLQVPLWWSQGLLVVGMLLLTLWQSKPWLMEDNSWPRLLKLGAAIVIGPAVLVMLLAFHRVSEVQPVALDRSLSSLLLSAQESPRPVTAAEEQIRLRLEQLSHVDGADNTATTDEIIELLRNDSLSLEPKYPYEETATQYSQRLTQILARQADEYLDTDQLDKALECHLANLRLARCLSRGSYLAWSHASVLQGWTLEKFVTWANHPLQTTAAIRAAMKRIEAELSVFPSATKGIARSYQEDLRRWSTSSRSQVIEALAELKAMERDSWGLSLMPALLPWERKRATLVMTRDAEIRFAAIWSLEKRLESPSGAANRTVTREFIPLADANELLIRTTPLSQFTTFPLRGIIGSVLIRHTIIRATLTRMELMAYRMEHGRLPERLVELMPAINSAYLVDPWSGRLFDFDSAFLLSHGEYGIELIPTNAREIELTWNGSPSDKRRLFSQLIDGSSEEINARAAELKKEGNLFYNLFPIPAPSKGEHTP